MRNIIVFFLCLLAFTSCDDGDMIVTSFNFDSDSDLQLCKSGSQNVLFVINTDPDESISFNFNDEDFDGTYTDSIENEIKTVPLNSSNQLIYRTYDGSLNGRDYFCTGIPPDEPKISKSYKSKNGGTMEIITTLTDQSIDSVNNTLTKKFETYAIAHNVTLAENNGNEEIVEETLHLGSFSKTAVVELDSLQTP